MSVFQTQPSYSSQGKGTSEAPRGPPERAQTPATHVLTLSSFSSFLFLRRWWRLTNSTTSTRVTTRTPAAAPMTISSRLYLVSSSLCLDCSGVAGAQDVADYNTRTLHTTHTYTAIVSFIFSQGGSRNLILHLTNKHNFYMGG